MPNPTTSDADSVNEAKVMNLGGGSNQARVRDYNERLVLSLIQREGTLSRAEIARRSGLSAQTVTIIARLLERDELVLPGRPVKGRVGQPSIPLALNPDGVFSIGLKIGRRSADLILMDFAGTIRGHLSEAYSYPLPGHIIEFVQDGAEQLKARLSKKLRLRLTGIGVAMPFEMWSWTEQIGASKAEMDAWRQVDMPEELSAATGLATFLENDATAACEAELALAHGREFSSFVYFFVGFFIGGGIVLNHAVYSGPTGNAGALGAVPVGDGPNKVVSLIDRASIHLLETALQESGQDPSQLWQNADGWENLGVPLERWIDATAHHIAMAIVAACAVVDFEAAVIDGGFPGFVRDKLVAATRTSLARLDARGISPVSVQPGLQGSNARAIGAARLPIAARYLMKRSVLFNALGTA